MPIELEFPVVRILQDEFHVIDEVFTGLVFQTHNELGRLCDEKVYQNELLSRAERAMEAARKEFRITVLNPVTAVKLSAVTKNSAAFESHLRKFLSLTSLECFQCINFNHHQIEFRTISRARR